MSLLEDIIQKEDISPLDDDYDYYKSLEVSPLDDDYGYYKEMYSND